MPTYDYKCSNCGHSLNDIHQSIHDKPLKKCKNCGKHKLERQIFPVDVFIRGEATTIGQQGEKNLKKLGKYKVSELKEKNKPKKKKEAWWGEPTRKESSKLNELSSKDKQDYIMGVKHV